MPHKGENIYRCQDGRWAARYLKGHTPDGKALYGYVYRQSYSDVRRAQAEATLRRSGLQASDSAVSSETLAEFLNRWLQSIQTGVRESTFANYDGLIRRHILPALGDMPLFQVTSSTIQKYIDQKLESGRLDGCGGLSVKTARDIVGLLKCSLKSAEIELRIVLPKYSPPNLRVLTREEQRALIAAAQAEDGADGLGVLLSLFTGIRIGELCSLKWDDVSFQDGALTVSRTLQRIENLGSDKRNKTVVRVESQKNQYSLRVIPLPSPLLCRMKQLRGGARGDDYVLSGSGRYVEPRLCQYRFKKLIKSAGIADINFYVLRHTFATRCAELGVDAKTISELLGHASVNVTLNRYVQSSFDRQRECLEKLSLFL